MHLTRGLRAIAIALLSGVLLSACGSAAPTAHALGTTSSGASTTQPSPSSSPRPSPKASRAQAKLPTAGNPNGRAAVPADARAVDTSHPTHVVGNGTAASCTSQAVVAAVGAGGVITFSCGAAPVTITLKTTAKIRNTSAQVVLDGGGRVTLSGGGSRRILYMNTCDQAQGSMGGSCIQQDQPRLTLQNLTFADANATGQGVAAGGGGIGGGGAVFAYGGRLTVINSRFVRGRCDATGPDLGGAAIRIVYEPHPATIVSSTFGGAPGQGGVCANGGALSSLHASWAVLNSVLSYNSAIGRGANPARAGTPGGGSGGAVYCDGDRFTLRIAGSIIENNHANEGGGAVFFVSNDRTGTLGIQGSQLRHNISGRFETSGFPGIFFLGAGRPQVSS